MKDEQIEELKIQYIILKANETLDKILEIVGR